MESPEGQLLMGSVRVQSLNKDEQRSACIIEEGIDSRGQRHGSQDMHKSFWDMAFHNQLNHTKYAENITY